MRRGAVDEINHLQAQLMAANALCDKLVAAVPTTWLDPLLTGPKAVIKDIPLTGHDVERLLFAVKRRLQQIITDSNK